MRNLKASLIDLGKTSPKLRPHLREILASLDKSAADDDPIRLDRKDLHMLAELITKVQPQFQQHFGDDFYLELYDRSTKLQATFGLEHKTDKELVLSMEVNRPATDQDFAQTKPLMEEEVKLDAKTWEDAEDQTRKGRASAYLPDVLSAMQKLTKKFRKEAPKLMDKFRKEEAGEAKKAVDGFKKQVENLGFDVRDVNTDDTSIVVTIAQGEFYGNIRGIRHALEGAMRAWMGSPATLNMTSSDGPWVIKFNYRSI